jgi:hypothetical protein
MRKAYYAVQDYTTPPRDALVEVQGLVIPTDWDQAGKVRTVAIASWDEKEYEVAEGEIARQLMSMLRQRVRVLGRITNPQGGKLIMDVEQFQKISKGREKPGIATVLCVAGLFALSVVGAAQAQQAQNEGQAPPAQQMEKAAPPAPEVVKPAPKKAASIAKPKIAKKKHKAVGKKWVRNLQEALNHQGYQIKVDGRMGKKTRGALKDYQKKNGLKASGRLDKATKAKLGMS